MQVQSIRNRQLHRRTGAANRSTGSGERSGLRKGQRTDQFVIAMGWENPYAWMVRGVSRSLYPRTAGANYGSCGQNRRSLHCGGLFGARFLSGIQAGADLLPSARSQGLLLPNYLKVFDMGVHRNFLLADGGKPGYAQGVEQPRKGQLTAQ